VRGKNEAFMNTQKKPILQIKEKSAREAIQRIEHILFEMSGSKNKEILNFKNRIDDLISPLYK